MSKLIERKYGFRWDNVIVERCFSVPGKGRVLLVHTPKKVLEIYVSEQGLKITTSQRKQPRWKKLIEEEMCIQS